MNSSLAGDNECVITPLPFATPMPVWTLSLCPRFTSVEPYRRRLERCRQGHPHRPRRPGRDVRVAVGVRVVAHVEEVFDVALQADATPERHVNCRIDPHVARK